MKAYQRSVILVFINFLVLQMSCSVQLEMDNNKEREVLLQTDREFSEYSVEYGAAEAFKKYLMEDALQLPTGQSPIYGRDSIYQSMKGDDDQYSLSWEPQDGEVASSGDLGWTWGIYTITIQTDKGEVTGQGKYLNVWKKDTDGNWRVLIDMGNQNPEVE